MAKQKFTVAQVCTALRETKGMVTLAAQRLGCDYNTVNAYIKRHDAVRQARDEAREKMGDAAELKLYSKAVTDGDTTALIFLLKTQFKQRGYVERSEHVLLGVSPDLLRRFVDAANAAGVSAGDALEAFVQELASADSSGTRSSSTGD